MLSNPKIAVLAAHALLLLACSTSVYLPSDRSQWPDNYAYLGFSPKINALAGADSLNCGFLDEVYGKVSKPERREAGQCVMYALDHALPFKFGTRRIPIDSYAHEVLVLSSEKEYWLITYDEMLDGSGVSLWIKKCDEVVFDKWSLSFKGSECAEVPTEVWLSNNSSHTAVD